MEEETAVQDSVVMGDVHVGDVNNQYTTIDQSTKVDQSTTIDMPSLDEVAEKMSDVAMAIGSGSKNFVGGLGEFLKGTINKILLFAGLLVVVVGFLIYNGNIDANHWIKEMF